MALTSQKKLMYIKISFFVIFLDRTFCAQIIFAVSEEAASVKR